MAGPRRGRPRQRRARWLVPVLCWLGSAGCLASSPPGGSDDGRASAERADRIELCVRNDGRLPATIQFLRHGDPIGPPVQVEGFARRCRSSGRSEMVGTLDVRVDPVAPDGTYFPESLRGILVATTTRKIEVTLVAEGIELYGQSSYRTWED